MGRRATQELSVPLLFLKIGDGSSKKYSISQTIIASSQHSKLGIYHPCKSMRYEIGDGVRKRIHLKALDTKASAVRLDKKRKSHSRNSNPQLPPT